MKNKIYLIITLAVITLTFNCCKKEKSDEPLPPKPPVATFTYTASHLYPLSTINFINKSSNATSYLWDFGDGVTSTLVNPQHAYLAEGDYEIKLIATGAGGVDTIATMFTIFTAPNFGRVKSIELSAMPFVNSIGTGWDASDGPDIFFAADGPSVYYFCEMCRVDNIDSTSLPLTMNLGQNSFVFSIYNSNYEIRLWDYDPSPANELIGMLTFKPSDYIPNYPDKVTLTGQGITVTLALEW